MQRRLVADPAADLHGHAAALDQLTDDRPVRRRPHPVTGGREVDHVQQRRTLPRERERRLDRVDPELRDLVVPPLPQPHHPAV